jgi:hypothetical protein
MLLLVVLYHSSRAEVEIITLDNRLRKGKIVQIQPGPPAVLTLYTAYGFEKIQGLDIVEILCKKIQKIPKTSTCIWMGDDSKIYGKITDGNQQSLHIESQSLGIIAIELTKIKEVSFNPSLPPLDKIDTENDMLYFKTGDMMKCLIESFGKGYVQIQHPQLGTRKEYFENLERITFAQLEKPAPATSSLLATIVGVDESRISGEITGFQADTLSMKLHYLSTHIHIPLDRIQHFFFKGGRFIYLSDLPSHRYEISYTPFFPGPIELFLPKLDQNQRGGPIRLHGHLFYKGFGVTSRTTIKVMLQGEFQRFQSFIGIDDEIQELIKMNPNLIGGSVVFQIFVDGEEKFNSDVMRWSTEAQMLDIEITRKKEMLLVVDFADNAHVNDLANWAGARLVK